MALVLPKRAPLPWESFAVPGRPLSVRSALLIDPLSLLLPPWIPLCEWPMPDASLASLVEALTDTGSAALILQRNHELLRTPSLRQCLNSLNCPLLVVR